MQNKGIFRRKTTIYTNKIAIICFFTLVANLLIAQPTAAKVGSGNMGNPKGRYSGTGVGFGNKKYDLRGRTLLNNPFSDSVASSAGRVVVAITVNERGKVIAVSGAARGSTSMDSVLVKKAQIAAYKAQFSASDTLPKQLGTMRFTYFKN